MERNDVFKRVQDALSTPPLLLIGSGCSATHGLPSMYELGEHLVTQLDSKYSSSGCWKELKSNLTEGKDLETALKDITLPCDLLNDIRVETWKLVSEKDLELLDRIVFNNETLPLSHLIQFFVAPHPKHVDIITTNYDRVIEYACDIVSLPLCTGFDGYYSKKYTGVFRKSNCVNLMKVHGSLDVYRDEQEAVVSLPLCKELPQGLHPEIITPGLSKYEAILKGTPRQLLAQADSAILNSKAFLCIGYGFNDEQIQENIIQRLRDGVPLVLLSRSVSEKTARLLETNAKQYIFICKGAKPNTTCFCINRNCYTLAGEYWTIDGLMSIIS